MISPPTAGAFLPFGGIVLLVSKYLQRSDKGSLEDEVSTMQDSKTNCSSSPSSSSSRKLSSPSRQGSPTSSDSDSPSEEHAGEGADEAKRRLWVEDMDDARVLVADAESRIEQLDLELDMKTQEVVLLTARVGAAEDAVAQLRAEKGDLQQQLQQAWTTSLKEKTDLVRELEDAEQALMQTNDAFDKLAAEMKLLAKGLQEQEQASATAHSRHLQLQRENADLVSELEDAEQAVLHTCAVCEELSLAVQGLALNLERQKQVSDFQDYRRLQFQQVLVGLNNEFIDLTHLFEQYQEETERATQAARKAAKQTQESQRQAQILVEEALRAADEARACKEVTTRELRQAEEAKRAEDKVHAKRMQVADEVRAKLKAEVREFEEKLQHAEDKAKKVLESVSTIQADAAASKEALRALHVELELRNREAAERALQLQSAHAANEELLMYNQGLFNRLQEQETEARLRCEGVKAGCTAELCKLQLLSRCFGLWQRSVWTAKQKQKCCRAAEFAGELKKRQLLNRSFLLWERQVKSAKEQKCHHTADLLGQELQETKAELKTLQDNLQSERLSNLEHLQVLEGRRSSAEVKGVDLEELTQFLVELGKELSGLCTDPISLQPMKDPVLAADLHTYERKSIEDWHKVSPTSPHSRAPMEITTLRSNRVVLWLAEANAKVFQACQKFGLQQADVPISGSVMAKDQLPQYVGGALVDSIMSREEDLCLELLAQPIDDLFLNGLYPHKKETWTLLQLALLHHLPRAAQAIVSRPDFRRGNVTGSSGAHAIHIASALGYQTVCQSIFTDSGPSVLTTTTMRRVTIEKSNGKLINLAASATCVDLARHQSHSSLVRVLQGLAASTGVS